MKDKDLTFDYYQNKISELAIYMKKVDEQFPHLPEGVRMMLKLSYGGLGLGESGEVQGKIKKIIRDSGGEINEEAKKQLTKELGDILWYVAEEHLNLLIEM